MGRPKNSTYIGQYSANIVGSVDGSSSGRSSGRSSGNSIMGGVSQSATAALFHSVAVVGGVTNRRHVLRIRSCHPAIPGPYNTTTTGKHNYAEICPRHLGMDTGDLHRRLPFAKIKSDQMSCSGSVVLKPIGERFISVTADDRRHVIDAECKILFDLPQSKLIPGAPLPTLVRDWWVGSSNEVQSRRPSLRPPSSGIIRDSCVAAFPLRSPDLR